MQLFALDTDHTRVLAHHAKKHRDYFCPECKKPVRLRQGAQIQAHFYHYQRAVRCTHRKKTLAHIHNQLHIADALPLGEAQLEHVFPSIGRIADVFWPKQKVVFEIQCSPMSLEEAQKREQDYACLGLKVVWILHETRYNRRRLTAVEAFYLKRNTYFTSITTKEGGMVYDQFDIVSGTTRHFKGARFPIALAFPYSVSPTSTVPLQAMQRRNERSLGFAGDFQDTVNKNPHYDYLALQALENRYNSLKKTSEFRFRAWFQTGLNVYRAFLYACLEKILMNSRADE